tara:strand:- start:14429 stop:15223 length:795 start_codon:yes stop_codon:yes gene_type:complete
VLVKAKKSLGQNFLIDENILTKIVNIGKINSNTEVLEIGPGTGNLTEYILKKNPNKFFVIEKDNNLVDLLKKKFQKKIEIINTDVLKINENYIFKNKVTVFGNLPYNISTQILSKWINQINNEDFWFSKLILMFQKEVADRIIAKENTKNFGRLSIISNWKLDVEKIIDIKPGSFFPKPKVNSSLLLFKPKTNFIKIKKNENLEMITRIFFNQKRKKIKKSFSRLFNNPKLIIEKLDIDENLRPQNLSTETYLKIAKEYESLRN